MTSLTTTRPRPVISGAPEGFDARLIADALRGGASGVVHVARDDRRMAAMRAALGFIAPDAHVIELPAWDCLPYDRVSPSSALAAARVAALSRLAHGIAGRFVVLTTVAGLTQFVPRPEVLREASLAALVGQRIDEGALRAFLVRMGFCAVATVREPGEYAVRGGIIDIFAPGAAAPVRLDLFGDVLDGARSFDPESQRTLARLDRVELTAVSEIILDEAAIARFRQAYRAAFGAAGADDPLYGAISAGRRHQGMEHWLPFFHDGTGSLFDYLKGAAWLLDDRFDAVATAREDQVGEAYAARIEAQASRGRIDSVYKPCAPELLYLPAADVHARLSNAGARELAVLPRPTGLGVTDAGGRIGRNFAPERQREDVNLFDAVTAFIAAQARGAGVLIACHTEGSRERMRGILADHGLAGVGLAAPGTWPREGQIATAVWDIETGFSAPGITIISEQDILGERLVRTSTRRRRPENFLTEAAALSAGDLVVHLEHGIGRFTGLETVTAAGKPHECLALEYAGGDRLFLPVENVELLSRYGHEEGLLDKLGGGAWQAKKARLKERIRDMADRLIRVAAERMLRTAPEITPPHGAWEDFCARFPYEETEDQMTAISAVLDDLDAGRPMDRLICGDVGFGKTEVAMRAAFVAAMAGQQVAVIAPTTLLARQHYLSFAERFRGFPLKVRPLSRFVAAKTAEETRKGLADGTVDIVVGTHALLAKGIRFKRLGLLVIDEEQHFGVAHKERLKQIRSDIHVLTLTATPIPRTLQLSLSGVRELSLIGTPPVDRLAIRTYVSEFDTVTIREALLRERYRGGQSFFVVPRISDLPEIEDFLAREVPEVKFVTAHGQMAAGELDRRVNDFYDGKHDVLLATSIIESGLDIPTANTMVVHRADMFGLAQLYQIRGRVGRSKTRAYAFLTTRPRQKLTPQAERRLRVIGSLHELGAGFALASQDMDIRGAGNLLGEEQSGHIREVGYELYQAMLEEAIAKLRAGSAEGLSDMAEDWVPQLGLGVPVLIPEDYVPDLDLRLGLYRRLSGLEDKVEMEGFAAELIDRFGKLPREVTILMNVVRIKAMCKRAGIARLDAGPKGASLTFHRDKFANPAGLVDFIHAQKGFARIRDNKLVVQRDWQSEGARLKGAFAIARDLAARVKASG